ncbi:transcriptional regulator [Collibacillus ludicampi]|uniref:Transcriptional regulator n=1 Tax=Collibacillus ludicampi TaxID=2771369 RepID=A0AAV4LK64_9BACL|nr:XRE family transcriptional regulator [Collibacillus ludicampi]GIM48121.1 transcriptional regulator [Collibacillus ludicampi]
MEHIHIKIGKNLHRIRKNRGYTLDKVAELTGVSKGMLGQIERGATSPTVTTLWKIASGLNISFSSLIEEESPAVSVISLANIRPLLEEDGKFRVYPMFPFDQKKRFEMYTLELEPGCRHESEAHGAGVEEYVHVSQGALDIIYEQKTYTIRQESAIRFLADKPHTYYNGTESVTRAQLLIYYGL